MYLCFYRQAVVRNCLLVRRKDTFTFTFCKRRRRNKRTVEIISGMGVLSLFYLARLQPNVATATPTPFAKSTAHSFEEPGQT